MTQLSGFPGFLEVNAINRQKFLAELAKLLTFMYEEDRQRALSMYERMFDIAEDEQGLIQHLMSPTRQAVIIARAYDAKERKLSVSSQSRGDAADTVSGEIPKFVLAINKIFDDLFPDVEETPEPDQVSFFDLGLAEKKDFVEEKPTVPPGAVLLSDTQKFRLDAVDTPDDAVEDSEEVDTSSYEADDTTAALSAPAAEAEEAVSDYLADGASIDELISAWKKDLAHEAASAAEVLEESAPETGRDSTDASSAVPEENAPEQDDPSATEPEADEDSVESRTSDAGELLPEEEAEAGKISGSDESALPEDVETAPEEDAVLSPEEDAPATADVFDIAPDTLPENSVVFRQKTSVPKLVLFLILAIPVTLALLALLLIPALLFLGIAVGLVSLGATLAVSAFSGISVLADLLLLIGAALVTLALGLLFLWLAIWVIVSGMIGLIRSVRDFGRRFCIKEVPAA